MEKEKVAEPQAPKMRQVVIETDGNNINISKNETAGVFELVAILQTILNKLIQKN
jgi:hypothetical protein